MNEMLPTPDQALAEDTQTENMLPESPALNAKERRTLSAQEKMEIFRTAIEEGVTAALDTVAKRFETPRDPADRLEFHNTRHTKDVIRRFDAIMDAIRQSDPSLVDDRGHAMGRFAAGHHDTVQKWEPNPIVGTNPGEEGLIKIMRKRLIGANEAESTKEAIAFMERVNADAGDEIFSAEDMAIVGGGHEATIPGFDPKKGTVIQPKLTDQSSIITRAIALADLGTAGMDGKEHYLPEGDALFREENLDIASAVEQPEALTDAQKEFFRKRMLGWSQFQATFAAGRRAMLEEELRPLPEPVRKEVEKLFGKFDESIQAAAEQAARRQSLSFEELARDMGYTLGKAQ